MHITLPLTPAEEAALLAKARAAGTTPGQLVRSAIEPIISSVPESTAGKLPKKSMLGILAKYGPAPSAADIDDCRKEMFAGFGWDDIA